MNQLKSKNPQMFQRVEKLRNSNGNPITLLQEVTKDYTPEQLDNFYNNAKKFGIPEDVINQAKGINTKRD